MIDIEPSFSGLLLTRFQRQPRVLEKSPERLAGWARRGPPISAGKASSIRPLPWGGGFLVWWATCIHPVDHGGSNPGCPSFGSRCLYANMRVGPRREARNFWCLESQFCRLILFFSPLSCYILSCGSCLFSFSFFFPFFFLSHDQSREPSLSLKTLSVSGTLIVSFSPLFFLIWLILLLPIFPKMSSFFFSLEIRCIQFAWSLLLVFCKASWNWNIVVCMKHHFITVFWKWKQ